MDGVQSIEDEPTSLDWPTSGDSFIDAPTEAHPAVEGDADGDADASAEDVSDESLWSRSRDFDWGD
jgi:hypothetical protein